MVNIHVCYKTGRFALKFRIIYKIYSYNHASRLVNGYNFRACFLCSEIWADNPAVKPVLLRVIGFTE